MCSVAVMQAIDEGHVCDTGDSKAVPDELIKKQGLKGKCKKCGLPWPCTAILKARALPQKLVDPPKKVSMFSGY